MIQKLMGLVWLFVLGLGCASVASRPIQSGAKPAVQEDLQFRQGFYDKNKVTDVLSGGYQIQGRLVEDKDAIAHFTALGEYASVVASKHADQANAKQSKAFLIPPLITVPVGTLIGLAAGLLQSALSSASFASQSEKDAKFWSTFGMGAGAGVGLGLAIGLPLGFYQHSKIMPERRKAANAFNRELAESLGIEKLDDTF